MKEIRAIVRLEKMEEVKSALDRMGLPGLMVSRIEGHGRQSGVVEQFRGREFRVDLIPKARFEIVCREADVERIVETVMEAARTGEIGDGKIFVYDVADAVRIRSGERGEAAV